MRHISIKYFFVSLIILLVLHFLLNHSLLLVFNGIYIAIITMFIISLPLVVKKGELMIIAFVLGLFVDMFYFSLGLHSLILVIIAFLKSHFARLLFKNLPEENFIGLHSINALNYILFLIINYLLFYFILSFIQLFNNYSWGYIIKFIILNSILSIVVNILIDKLILNLSHN